MKKNFIYSALIILFLSAVGFIIISFANRDKAKKVTYYELKERKGPMGVSAEWVYTQNTASQLIKAVRDDPKNKKAALQLATIFIQEARITGNYMYYDMAALKQIESVLEQDPNDFEALSYKALIYLSQHHFTEGLQTAEAAVKINPYNAFIYGILIDANVELGNYDAAVGHAEKMISIRPDIRSYSRISYLREIHGDYPGAIDAMKMAVDAGLPGDESTEWARVQLANLYEKTGDLKSAEMHYLIAIEKRPHYAYAIAGLGSIATANKNYSKAISYYQQADTLLNDNSFKEALIDLYSVTGQPKKAEDLSATLIQLMAQDANTANSNEELGHYNDQELAYVYLKEGNADKALEHALAEYNRRPKNIDVNETLAWAYYNKKDYAKATKHIEQALRTNSKNPTLLCHAGLIYAESGNKAKAATYLKEGLQNNPVIDQQLKDKSTSTLQKL